MRALITTTSLLLGIASISCIAPSMAMEDEERAEAAAERLPGRELAEASSSACYTITASPRTVALYGEPLGTTRICWETPSAGAQVWVSVDGGEEKLFAAGSRGCQAASWIQAGYTYTFTLYPDAAHSFGVVEVRVTAIQHDGPRPCRPGTSHHCDPEICWPSNRPCP